MNNIDQLIVEPNKSDHEIFIEILERTTNQGLESLMEEIKEELEMRKFKNQRINKLRLAFKTEKNNLLKELKRFKMTMIQEHEESDSTEETVPKKKAGKRK